MRPIRIKRSNGSVRSMEQKKKRIQKTVLALFLSLVVVAAAFFTVYAVSRNIEANKTDEDLTEELRPDATVDMTMQRGESCTLTLPEGVDILNTKFTSSDAEVVRVDDAGKVDGLKEGTATVTATAEEFSASCVFRIEKAENKRKTSEVTTAYLANLDVLYDNIEKGKDNLYRLVVNRRTNTVTVYTYDSDGSYTVPVRARVCSCGAGGADITPVGDYKTNSKREWATLYGDKDHEYLFGQYVTGFYGEYLFHSVPYESENKYDLEIEEFNKLGTNASQGCVRLSAADSCWIYKNCSLNTPVSVIDADASSDPLGTPPTVKQNIYNGWDPTDPDDENPFKGKLPRIIGLEDSTLMKGQSFDPMEGITAKDICGNLITDRVKVTGKVLTDKPGVYYLTYKITDDFFLSRTATRIVTVK